MPVVDRWYSRGRDGKKVRTGRYGRGKRWVVEWVEADGRRRSKSFDTKDEAELNYAAIRADIHRGTYIDPDGGNITFRAYAEQWLETQKQEPLTRINVRNRLSKHVYPHLGHLPLAKIKPSTIKRWATHLASLPPENRTAPAGIEPANFRLSGTTRERLFSHVSSILQAAVDDELIAKNPAKARSVGKPRKDTEKAQPWPSDRVAAVHEQLPARWRPALLLAIGCGLRRGEIMGFSPTADVDWHRNEITVRRQVLQFPSNKKAFSLPKYGKIRTVPMPGFVREALLDYMKVFPPREVTLPWRELEGDPVTVALLLTSREGKVGTSNYVSYNVWKPACRRAGFEPTNRDGLHVLRHTYASTLLDAGESIVVVAARLGHADPSFTLRTYAHLIPNTEHRTRDVVDGYLQAALNRREESPEAATGSDPVTYELRTEPNLAPVSRLFPRDKR